MSSISSGTKPRNPYYHSTAVRDPDMFFGRARTLERLYSLIADHQNVSLIGPRRIGKSSVLTCMCIPEVQTRFTDRDLSKHILVLLDFEEHLQKTPDDFLRLVSEQLVRQSQDQLRLEMLHSNGTDEFSQLLDHIKDRGFHPVLLLDEFDSITSNPQFSPSFFMFLRALANKGKVSYVTGSLTSLDQLSHPDLTGSPFFNIFHFHRLGPFTRDAAWDLINVPSDRAGCPFVESEANWVLELAGRHPFFIQRVCYFLFEEKCRRETKDLNYRDIEAQVYSQLEPHFEYSWAHLNAEQQDQLKDEARLKGARARAVPELSESSLFRQFVRNKHGLVPESPEITTEYLKDVLDKIDDMRLLGESKLSYLNVIYAQGPADSSSQSTVERGILVGELLRSAVERLRPKGSQQDLAPEWRPYNILYYRYFEKGITNEQISARLGIGERQFYRDWNKAIQALLDILLEMEALSERESGR